MAKILLRSDRLRESREKLGLTQRELARLCGMAPNMINRYEHGRADPSASHMLLIAEKLGISADYLLGLSGAPNGQLNDTSLSRDEQEVVDILRRDGWKGVLRLAADRMTK